MSIVSEHKELKEVVLYDEITLNAEINKVANFLRKEEVFVKEYLGQIIC